MKGIFYLLGLCIVIILIIIFSTSCVSTFYKDGKVTARIMGDYSYKDGDIEIKVNHSIPIKAGGISSSQTIGAIGSSVTAIKLIK